MKNKMKLQLRSNGAILLDEQGKVFSKLATPENVRFGIWGVSENKTFYPTNTAANTTPKPEDFALIPFRLISSTIVASGTYRATRFPDDILKASMSKLEGVPVYTDHDTETVKNCIGYVDSVEWQESYTDAKGNVIPSGINGYYAIDTKIDPVTARNCQTGAITSNSVTIEFYWQPSHPFQDDDFYYHLGEVDKRDGKEVCRVATEILGYDETSPVFKGADPFAKKLNDNNEVIRPDMSRASYAVLENEEKLTAAKQNSLIICEKQKMSFSFTPNKKPYTQQEGNKDEISFKMNKELLKFLAAFQQAFATDTAKIELTDEMINDDLVTQLNQNLSMINNDAEKLTAAQNELTALTTKFNALTVEATIAAANIESLTAKINELTPLAETGKTHLQAQRSEALRLYNIVSKGTPNAAVAKLIEQSDLETAHGFIESYGGQLLSSEYKATCSKCGDGEHISFRTSKNDDAPQTPVTVKQRSIEDVLDQRANSL